MRKLDHLPKSCKICPIFCGGGCSVSRGVENQFAPDEFIPWPKDENWVQAVLKAGYNRVRKTIHSLQTPNDTIQRRNKCPQYPKVSQRFRIRRETDGSYVAMFEKLGVVTLSPLAAQLLALATGEKAISEIVSEVSKSFPKVSEEEIEGILLKFI